MDKNFRIDIHRLEAFGENYSREVKTLLHKLQITSDLRRHCVYLKEFAKIFTLLPELWQYWNLIEKSLTCAEIDSLQNKHFRSTQKLPIGDKHFYVNCLYNLIIFPYHETSLQKFKRTKPLKEGLFYPHKDIDKLYHAYVRNSSSALSEKEFKEFKTALFLYNKLKDAGQNIDEWFKWLKETNDLEYIINTCEYRLSENPYDLTFWCSYLHFLKAVDTVVMLKTYSRYCRLFLYDYSMIHDYYDDLVKAQIRCKVEFWIDYICLYKMQKSFDETVEKMLKILIEFYGISENWSFKSYFFDDKLKEFAEVIKDKERVVSIFETLETNESSQQSLQHMKDGKPLTPSIPKVLTPAIHQQYSFKSPIMRYLLDHASTQLLQKLQMSCKDLYLQNPFVYCQNLCIKKELKTNRRNETKTVFFENALIMSSNNLQHFDFKNCHLVNSLEIVGLPPCTLPYFGKCSLKYLTLENQSISENEVQYLASKLEFLKFVKVTITKSNGTIAPIEYVVEKLSHIPNIMLIDPLKTSYTETTDQNLAALKFDRKFKSFYLNQLPEDFNIQNLCEFIKANAAEDADLKFNYDSNIDFFLKFELGQRLRNEIQMISNNFNVAII